MNQLQAQSDGKIVVSISRPTANIIATKTVLDQNGNVLYTAGQPCACPSFCLGLMI